ncbi:hypothetical protein [Rhizobium leguminosarum]|uniref:hypothetical protein n=1 Tax=Rhizobium leguminosarum TaxID=384 RepID=UPI003F98AAEC
MMKVDVAIIESCSTASFRVLGPLREAAINLSVRLLDGHSSAVISPYRSSSPIHLLWAHLWSMCQEGSTVAEISSAANLLAVDRCKSMALNGSPYVLFGDPRMVAFPSQHIQPRSISISNVARKRFVATLPPDASAISSYTVDIPPHNGPESAYGNSSQETFDFFPGNHRPRRLIAIRTSPQTERQLTIDLTAPFDSGLTRCIADFKNNCRTSRFHALSTEWDDTDIQLVVDRTLAKAERIVVGSAQPPVLFNQNRTDRVRFETSIDSILSTVNENFIMSAREYSLGTDGLWIRNFYNENGGITAIGEYKAKNNCTHCSGEVRSRRYKVGLWPPMIRELHECETCMFLYDGPVNCSPIIFDGPEFVSRGKPVFFSIRTVNRKAFPVFIAATLAVDRLRYSRDLFRSKQSVQSVRIDARQTFIFECDLTFSPDLPRHQFNIKALLSINGAFAWALKKVQIQ